jgi:F-type H+-transporting ATPase subunit delta
MKVDPVTARYVDALFGLATRQGLLSQIEGEIKKLASALDQPGAAAVVFHPGKDAAVRRAYLNGALEGASDTFRNFVDLLFDKHRDEVLMDLGEAFRQRLLREEGIVEGIVESARPLGSGELAELTVALGERLGKQVRLANTVSEGLIAGVRVIVDNKMVDSSVAGRFDDLKRRMMDAALPSLN